MKSKILFLSVSIFAVALTANAQGLSQDSVSPDISAFRFYKDIGNVSINVPTVVGIPFTDENIERLDFAVLDDNAKSFEPYFFKQETKLNEIPVSISTNPIIDNASWMNDGFAGTSFKFQLPDNAQRGKVQIILSSPNPITSSKLDVLSDIGYDPPSSIEIRAFVKGQNRIVVANGIMDQNFYSFPQTTSDRWTVTFTFRRPLYIGELRLIQDNATKSIVRTVRFLAQPLHSYRIYFDPDRSVAAPVGEAGNLASVKDVLIIPTVPSQNNPNYIIADIDGDGVPDIRDNCVSAANPDQQDINNNGKGDVCDDFDQDGLVNSEDNCPNNPNLDQEDADSDGIGDVCDKEESRITERYVWIPWVGIGFAALVLIILFTLTAKTTRSTGRKNKK